MFGRASITLGIGPHSNWFVNQAVTNAFTGGRQNLKVLCAAIIRKYVFVW